MPAAKPQNAPTLDAATLASLGRNLSLLYVETLERPVPDHLLAILQRLESPSPMAGVVPAIDQARTSPAAIAN